MNRPGIQTRRARILSTRGSSTVHGAFPPLAAARAGIGDARAFLLLDDEGNLLAPRVGAEKTIKEVVEKVTNKLDYHLEIRVNDVEFITKTIAKDMETALTKFVESPDFPFGAKTKTIIK